MLHDATTLPLCACGCGLSVKRLTARFLNGHHWKITTEERFWSHVQKLDDPESCWPWVGSHGKRGYGAYMVGRTYIPAHRYAYALRAPLSPEALVLHTCDNPCCVRNDDPGYYEVRGVLLPRWGHLAAGTYANNSHDAIDKRRMDSLWIARGQTIMPRGEANSRATLTAEDVRAIRREHAAGDTGKTLAKRFSTSEANISRIVLRQAWKHI